MAARESWGSRFGFIMATAGFAIGLGNIWRFPYLVGQYGGGAWVLVYTLCAILIGIPLFTAEVSLGRRAQLMAISGMRAIEGRRGSPWTSIGWFGVTATVLILSYYLMLIGWVTGYTVLVTTGHFRGMNTDQVAAHFADFIAQPLPVLGYTAIGAAACAFVVAGGLQKGLERVAKIMMPALFIMILLLMVRALTFPGAMAGLSWYLKPDFSKLNAAAVLAALGQCFFSIGIGMAGGFGFGSYLHRTDSDVPGDSTIVVIMDTVSALLVGLVIFPALFAFGLQPDSGPGLLFVTMPNLFERMPAGQIFGGMFFLLVFVAGFASAISLIEIVSGSISDLLGLRRGPAVWTTVAAVMLLQIPIILSQGPWSGIRIWGRDLFGLVDWISGDIILAIGGILISLYVGWVWGFPAFRADTNQGATWLKVPPAWGPFIKVVIPAVVAVILLRGLGLF